MKEKRYKIWLIIVWSDLGAVWVTKCATSYPPEQWFAEMWLGCNDDYAKIIEFDTNLEEDDHRLWDSCTVTRSDYNDNEHWPVAVSNVGTRGNVPVITFKPNGERAFFEELLK